MSKQIALQKVFQFFLIKMIIGIVVVGGFVAFSEWSGRWLLDRSQLSDELKNVMIAISDSAIALFGYILLFRLYENRRIKELSLSTLGKNAILGFTAGLILQSLFILVIYITGNYSVIRINPVSFLLPSFTTALTAGFVSEILIRGIIFRITEEKLGSVVALFIITLLFALLHVNVEGATLLSVCSTAMQAGVLLSAAWVFTRSLWFTIFLHFAWDFAEPGIFGALNPGNSIRQSLFSGEVSGPAFLTGGPQGPQNSIQALIICAIAGLLFLWMAKQKHNFIKPYWNK
jgi:hypothetical protein